MPLNLEEISEFFRNGDYYITRHGYEELDDDSITIEQLETAIGHDNPKIIEDYPNDPRGASCLILGDAISEIKIHVCIGVSGSKPEVITAYIPSPEKFCAPEFAVRRRKTK